MQDIEKPNEPNYEASLGSLTLAATNRTLIITDGLLRLKNEQWTMNGLSIKSSTSHHDHGHIHAGQLHDSLITHTGTKVAR